MAEGGGSLRRHLARSDRPRPSSSHRLDRRRAHGVPNERDDNVRAASRSAERSRPRPANGAFASAGVRHLAAFTWESICRDGSTGRASSAVPAATTSRGQTRDEDSALGCGTPPSQSLGKQRHTVPHDMLLGRAHRLWGSTRPREFCGDSDDSMDPRMWISCGWVVSTSIALHVRRVHQRIGTTRAICTRFDDDDTSTTSDATTSSLPLVTEERPLASPAHGDEDDPPTFPEILHICKRFCDPERQMSRAQHHNSGLQPMDTCVAAGDN